MPGHGKTTIREAAVLPWVRQEVAKLKTPERAEVIAVSTTALASIEARRERLTDALEAGALDRARYAERMVKLDAEAAAIEQQRSIVTLPTIEWETDPPAEVNGVLRSLWHHVELGPDLMPVKADWRVPQWRA